MSIQKSSELTPSYDISRGEKAWKKDLKELADLASCINTSFGPNGFYKMVIYNRGPEQVVKITRDPVLVLDELSMKHPYMVVISEAAKMQRQEYGDGAKYFTIILSMLLKKSLELMELGVHANNILSGYREATKKSLSYLDSISTPLLDEENLVDLVDCGRGIIDPKLKEIMVEAYTSLKCDDFEKENVNILHKMGGRTCDSYLVRGLVIEREKTHPEMPDRIENPRIALITNPLYIKRLELKMKKEGHTPIEIKINSPQDINSFLNSEKILRENLLSPIKKYKIDVVFCANQIDEKLTDKLAKMNVLAFENVDRDDLNKLAKAINGKVISKLEFITEGDIGSSEVVYVDELPPEKIVIVEGCNGSTVVTRSVTSQMKDDLNSVLKNYYCLLETLKKDYSGVPGQGVTELKLADYLNDFSLEFDGKEQIVIQNFIEAILEIPKNLANSYGFYEFEAKWKYKEFINNVEFFSDVTNVKKSAIRRAFEVCELLLKIDTTMVSKDLVKVHK